MKACVQKSKVKTKVCSKVVQTVTQTYMQSATKDEALSKAKEMLVAQLAHGVTHYNYEENVSGSDSDSDNTSKIGEVMMTDFSELPFAMPHSTKDRHKINEILKFSLRQQKEDEISDNPAVVTHLVSRCLTAAGITNRIAYGYCSTMPNPSVEACSTSRDVDEFAETRANLWRSPHVWLVIDGHIIDNTYIKDMPYECCKYLIDNTPHCYEEATYIPSSASSSYRCEFSITAEESAHQVSTVMKKRIEFCMRRPDMALALSHNRMQFYTYFFAMVRHMHEVHNATVSGIDPNVRLVCWWCGSYPDKGKDLYSDTLAYKLSQSGGDGDKEDSVSYVSSSLSKKSWQLQQCSRCMVANYCSKECQRQDWLDNHRTMCLSRGCELLPPITNVPYGGAC